MATKPDGNRTKYIVRRGSVQAYVYTFERATKTEGETRKVYTAAWYAGGRRVTRQFSTFAQAHAEAQLKCDQLAAGRVGAASTVKIEDADTLTAAKKLCGPVPLLAALQEWEKGRKLCGGSIIAACEAWKAKHAPSFKRIKLSAAIRDFIRQKDKAGKQGEYTYTSKLKPLTNHFTADPWLDDITTKQLAACYAKIENGNTRNDYRKRAVSLWTWARDNQHLPTGLPLAIENTERADETRTEIGIINADTFGKLLEWTRAKHPEHLAAAVLAGFCGVRSDEIHGKRKDRTLRQTWEDIHLDRKFLRVTVAKKNTAAWRFVPLCDAAIEWLMLCDDRKGDVCEAAAMEKLRVLWKKAKFKLPENCLRHSFISCRIAVTNNKPQVANEAGNSVAQIDKHYRVPITAEEGAAWFAIKPKEKPDEEAEVIPITAQG